MASITNNNKIKSIAYQQLGNINESKNKLKNATEFYKKSILSNNSNFDSKYNYELVTKKLKEQEKKKQENKNQENKEKNNKEEEKKKQENKNQENKEKNNKEQENKNQQNKEQEKSIEEKLKEVNMSKKKAEMILNALNNIEFQYIQQLKRKASKKIDKNKPDW
jgi:predicted flap endonuclease-1-like 5' DNA nuclease